MGLRLLNFAGSLCWVNGAYNLVSASGLHSPSIAGLAACIILACVCLYAAVGDKP